jgi:hypothetical protein
MPRTLPVRFSVSGEMKFYELNVSQQGYEVCLSVAARQQGTALTLQGQESDVPVIYPLCRRETVATGKARLHTIQ